MALSRCAGDGRAATMPPPNGARCGSEGGRRPPAGAAVTPTPAGGGVGTGVTRAVAGVSGLPHLLRQKIIFHLKERGIGVLITDHNVRETLRITDRAYIVHDGTIFRSGTPDRLATDEDVRRIYRGTDFRLD